MDHNFKKSGCQSFIEKEEKTSFFVLSQNMREHHTRIVHRVVFRFGFFSLLSAGSALLADGFADGFAVF